MVDKIKYVCTVISTGNCDIVYNTPSPMSFVCCEIKPTLLPVSTCITTDVSGSSTTGEITSQPVYIDLTQAPFRRRCLTASAPVTVADSGTINLTLYLYRQGSDTPIDSLVLTQGIDEGLSAALTPVLVNQVNPGVYYAQLRIVGSTPNVSGRINITASVTSLVV
jgi:hypothetical protein